MLQEIEFHCLCNPYVFLELELSLSLKYITRINLKYIVFGTKFCSIRYAKFSSTFVETNISKENKNNFSL